MLAIPPVSVEVQLRAHNTVCSCAKTQCIGLAASGPCRSTVLHGLVVVSIAWVGDGIAYCIQEVGAIQLYGIEDVPNKIPYSCVQC